MARKGRPRKAGPRYPSGQRVSAGPAKLSGKPTEQILAKRRAILGKPDAKISETRAAENPLDTMAERGWIDRGLARAGHALAELYRRAGISGARVTAQLEEAPETSGVDTRRIRDMSDEEISAIWSVIERKEGAGTGLNEGDPAATAKLKTLWTGLGPEICAELYAVCVLQSWPLWAMQMVAGRAEGQIPAKWLRKKALLVDGLEIVQAVVSPRRPKPAREPERDHPFLGGPVVEEVVEYVDDQGLPDPVLNRAGVAVEVVRRRRAG